MAVDLSDLDGLRDDLKRLNAVMLYPLILEDRLELNHDSPLNFSSASSSNRSSQRLTQSGNYRLLSSFTKSR